MLKQGYGAAIAAGNHAEKGTCALFVHAERIKMDKKILVSPPKDPLK
jgi:hypothetical protein